MVFDNEKLLSEADMLPLRTIDLSCQDALQPQLHMLRHTWRREKFAEWLRSSRHEAAQMLSVHSGDALMKTFHSFDWELIRKSLSLGPGHRTVLLGSGESDAWMAAIDGLERSSTCCLCGNAIGHLLHLFWECEHTADLRRHYQISSPPDCPLRARFGWLRKKEDLNVLHHMACCIQLLWQSRHGACPWHG